MDYTYLLLLAVVLLSTKVFGVLTEHVHLPQVVGALLAGIVMGPSGFGVLQSTDFMVKAAEIGVIMLMFTAGIDTDMKELKETGVQASVIAVLGVFVPLLLCGGLYFAFFCGGEFTAYNLLRSAFMGSVFSATSVSITVETLNEMGKLKSKTGTTLLSAALIDDIIGIVVLSVLSAFSSGDSDPVMVMVRIVLFFAFVLVVGLVVRRVFSYIAEEHWHSRRVAVWALAFCLLMSYCAGLILCNVTKARRFVAKKFTVTSYMVFTPVFFASVGMKTNLRDMNGDILVFALLLVAAAVLSKVAGCGMGGLACRMSRHQSLVVGIGMVARSEVALMVAQRGINAGMIDRSILPAIVLAVISSALLTPVLLKMAISKGPELA